MTQHTESVRKPVWASVVAISLLLSLLATALETPVAEAGGGASSNTEDNEILVITTNMQEAFGESDVRNSGDMKNYVRILLGKVKHYPDVLLLQEITGKPARVIASQLTKKTGQQYKVIVDPGTEPWKKKGSTVIKTETAILINNVTMKKEHRGGFVTTTYKWSEAAPNIPREKKKQAYSLVSERATGLELALSSLHFSLSSVMKSKSLAEKKRGAWTNQIKSLLNKKYGKSTLKMISGDFNTGRCLNETANDKCELTYPWRVLYKAGFRNAVHLITEYGGVDNMYTNAGIMDAKADENYNGKKASGKKFYSDHQLRWAHISSDVTPPSVPVWVGFTEINNRRVKLDWDDSIDAEGDILRYEVWRHAKNNDDYRLRTDPPPSADSEYTDSVYSGKKYKYWYYIVAVDEAHWTSKTGEQIYDP